ncbi:hypothetical protein [Bacteriovorax sp. DB6_IX]|uniref:hypothetical protein n=1 Tax=Bacteriovorax sp. DB6_IX TaxID=1353530 RepID=UPI000389F9B2|nr:hypothetical protein [Bacteriovorax sp. DB6_IX]EQC51141.1 hypothetical protein M901_0737 [Bacteriovorax sp. DB6_IX]
MNVVILDSKNQFTSDDFPAHVHVCHSLDELITHRKDKVDALVLTDGCEMEELEAMAKELGDSLWKLFVPRALVMLVKGVGLSSDVVTDAYDDIHAVSVLQQDQDSTALRRHGVDLSQVSDYDIKENKRIQDVVDKVYKDRETFMSIDDNNEDEGGLNFNMPAEGVDEGFQDEVDEATKHDISLELGDADDTEDEETQALEPDESDAMDLGDSTSGGLSLSGEDDEIDNASVDEDQGSDLDLDMGTDGGLSLSEEGDEIDNTSVDEDQGSDLDLDMGTDGGLSLNEEGDEIDNIASEEAGVGDLDLDNPPAPPVEDSLEDDLDMSADDDLDDLGDLDDELDDDLSMSDDLDEGLDDLDDDLDDLDMDNDIGETTGATVVATLTDVAAFDNNLDLSEEDTTDQHQSDMTKTVGTETFKTKINMMLGDELSESDDTLTATNEEINIPEATQTLSDYSMPAQESTPIQRTVVEEAVTDGQLLTSLSSNELLDLRVTLKELKEDRQNLLSQISDLEEEKSNVRQDNLNLKADIDELKIEISILKKRHLAELEELKHQLNLSSEKREILEAKNKSYQKEMDRLGQKIRVDFGKIKQREKDLESQLELVSMDADSKVKSRDTKILELKRKIDSLEFNMENISIKERQSRKDKVLLEDKLSKVVGTLRNSLSFLEEEIDIEEIKKDLDI